MNRYKIIMIALMTVAAIVLLQGDSYSQTADRDKIISALDLTDDVIREARSVVMESRSQKARYALENAVSLQERARSRAESGNYTNLRQNDMAFKLTLQARDEAKKAVSFARTETRMFEKHRRVMERTRERLTVLQGRVSESGTRDIRTERLMNDARGLLEKSRTNSTQMKNRLALNLALNAEKLMDQAESRFRRTDNLKKMCQRRLSLMERLTVRARNRIAGNGDEGEREELRMAERKLEQARNLFHQGRYNACRLEIVKSEKSMRALINRAGPGEENRLQFRIRQAWRLYDRADEIVNETGEGEKLLEIAERTINSAEEQEKAGNSKQAGESLSRARMTLRKITNESRRSMSKERIRERIEELDMERLNIRDIIENCDAPESRTLYRRAINHIEKARDDLDAGNLESAYSATRVAGNIFDRITEICSI